MSRTSIFILCIVLSILSFGTQQVLAEDRYSEIASFYASLDPQGTPAQATSQDPPQAEPQDEAVQSQRITQLVVIGCALGAILLLFWMKHRARNNQEDHD